MRISVGGNNGPIIKWEAAGQTLEGTFLGLRDGKQFPGQPQKSKLADIKKADGTVVSCGAPTALAGKLSGLAVGTFVYIKYDGKQRGTAGVEYKAFTVEIDVPDGVTSGVAVPSPLTPTGIAALEQKLVASKGQQVAGLMIDALKAKFPDPAAYEKAVRDLLAAHGISA